MTMWRSRSRASSSIASRTEVGTPIRTAKSLGTGSYDAAAGNNALAADEGASLRCKKHRDAADLVGLTDAPQRRLALRGGANLWIVPQGAREIGLDKARRDGVDANVVLAPF